MKNKKNVGSFATAKLQAKRLRLLAIIALAALIGFSLIACGDDSGSPSGGGGGGITPSSGGRDSRLVCSGNEAWVDSYPVGSRDGFVFKADGSYQIIDDYSGSSSGVWAIYGTGSWTTSGNNTLTISGSGGSATFSYTVTGNTLRISDNSTTDTYTKTTVTIGGGGATPGGTTPGGTTPGGTTPGGGGGGGSADSALNGTWRDDDTPRSTLSFNNGTSSVFWDGVEIQRNSYTTSGGTITATCTHVYFDADMAAKCNTSPGMKTNSQCLDLYRAYVNSLPDFTQAEKDQLYAGLTKIFEPVSVPYSVSGNTLRFGSGSYTRIN